MFRLEGEVAYKHARLKSAMLDPNALPAVLLSPVTNTIVPAATGRSNVSSGMINALLDLGPSSGVNGSIGLGAGAARANYRAGLVPSNALNFSGQDRAFAWQALAEVRFPVSASVDEVPGLSERRCRSEVSLFPNSEAELRAILRYNLHNRSALSAAGQVQIQQPAGERRL
jgi:hypothetical protein